MFYLSFIRRISGITCDRPLWNQFCCFAFSPSTFSFCVLDVGAALQPLGRAAICTAPGLRSLFLPRPASTFCCLCRSLLQVWLGLRGRTNCPVPSGFLSPSV